MKKIKYIISVIILMFIISPTFVYSHSGRTDGDGGHHVGGTSAYHYHHGYPAHDHIDGVCPYDYDNEESDSLIINDNNDDEVDEIKSSSIKSIETIKKEDNTPLWKKIMRVCVGLWWLIIPLILGTYDYIKNRYFDNSKKITPIVENSNIKIETEVKPKDENNTKKETNKYICPRCGGRLIIKNGRYGRFIGCSNYPRCKYTKSLKK